VIPVATALKGYYTQGIRKTPLLILATLAGLIIAPTEANAQLFGYWRGRYDESQRQQRLQPGPNLVPAPQPQIDPALLDALNQVAANQQTIIALLNRSAPTPAPQIVVIPYQNIPLGGPAQQNIPLGGPPQQQIPLGGPPQQNIPLGGPPQQGIPLGGPPQQKIPIPQPQPTPAPAQPAPQAQPPQQIPLGYPPQTMPPATTYQRYAIRR
jgi:hypothetical protein